jgi:uncharacterized protein YcaQ
MPMSRAEARRRWIRAQRLDATAPFGDGPGAVRAAVEHLGYVQIDTIHVVERAHHHVLWSRIPAYSRADLDAALSAERTVFEGWAHALAYIPTRDYRFFMTAMRARRAEPERWFGTVTPADLRRVMARVRRDGPLTIRDIEEPAVEKTHLWASRKPSKRALEFGFLTGALAVSGRRGMLKTYDLAERHFGWPPRPRAATERAIVEYLLDRALRAQGPVSLASICYMDAPRKAAMAELIAARVRRGTLIPVAIEGVDRPHWIAPGPPPDPPEAVHILSPFDPLIIQRARLSAFFGYDHRFEAYVPAAKRKLGYFALPVLVDDRIVAAIDIKADRSRPALLIQNWTWTPDARDGDRARVDEALHRFEAFQFAP